MGRKGHPLCVLPGSSTDKNERDFAHKCVSLLVRRWLILEPKSPHLLVNGPFIIPYFRCFNPSELKA